MNYKVDSLLSIGLNEATLFVVASFVAFVIASTLGVGGTLLLVPILLTKFSAAEAVSLLAPVMLTNNIGRLWMFRTDLDRRASLLIGLTAIPSALLGSQFTGRIDGEILQITIIVFIIIAVSIPRLLRTTIKINQKKLPVWGLLIGSIAGLSGTAGPPMAIAVKGYGLNGMAFVATVSAVQIGIQAVRIPTYIQTGVFPTQLWLLTLLMSAASLASLFIAKSILTRLNVDRFRQLLDLMLVSIAMYMTLRIFVL